MKTFVHKKTGEEITYKDGCIYTKRTVIEAEPNLQFWEEVVEKEWEILSFVNIRGSMFEKYEEGLFYYKTWVERGITGLTERSIITDPTLKIHSIKRLSDGEVFTLGDRLSKDAFIRTIIMRSNSCWIGVNLNLEISLSLVKKMNPLFKTFDGVDVFEGDRYYYFRFHSWSYDMSIAHEKFYSQDKLSKNSLYFSSKEKAEEFIILNKPCLSLQEAINNNNESLKELVKSRL